MLVTIASWPQLHSFSIGLENSPDLIAARKAAHYLGTIHHEYVFTVQEGLDAIPDVIYHLETYDVTTVRASTPMYLLSRKIKAMGVKMVLSGEGSDEIFGGTSYSPYHVPVFVRMNSSCVCVLLVTCTSTPPQTRSRSTKSALRESRTSTHPIVCVPTSEVTTILGHTL